ncbi:MAG: PLP-dependent cysteine synthase family protein [Desulfobacterales bacterium]|nr:PLP-dependent cysteine synthase family protein [Desulfobacterales bacterium]
MNKDNKVYDSIADLIADIDNPTPMVRLNERINPSREIDMYLKLERFNPFGSIKDRIAKAMIEGARIVKGQKLVEPSSGNTGVALTALANAMDIPVEIAVPERIPEEKKILLRLLGVSVLWEADDQLCPIFPNEGARGLVNGILHGSEGSRYVNLNQYENDLNVMAHYRTTGPEIWKQTEGKVNYFFAGFGTCGTITGVGRYLKEQNPEIQIIGIEPARADHNLPGMKRITGLRGDLVPTILDSSVIDHTLEIEDDDAYRTAIELARKTGILVGPTTGAILKGALNYTQNRSGCAVVISPDDAFKYTSLFSPYVADAGKLDI